MNYKEKIKALLKYLGNSSKLAEVIGVDEKKLTDLINDEETAEKYKEKIESAYNRYVLIPSLKKDEVKFYVNNILSFDDSHIIRDNEKLKKIADIHAVGSYEISVENSINSSEIENLKLLTKRVAFETIEGKLNKLTTEIIKKWHLEMFIGIREDAGKYSNQIRKIKNSNVSFMSPENIEKEMEYWTHLYNDVSNIYGIAKAHEHFEMIRPFDEGNGRIGRLIMLHQFLKLNILPSLINKNNKFLYYASLEEAMNNGDILALVYCLTKGVEEMRRVILNIF